MILPGVPREQRIPFSGKMMKLFLEIGFMDDLPELSEELEKRIDDLVGQAMTAEEAETAAAPGGC